MYIPTDPNMLLSIINMKLRDETQCFDDFCADNDLDKNEITNNLLSIGYKYDSKTNQFI